MRTLQNQFPKWIGAFFFLIILISSTGCDENLRRLNELREEAEELLTDFPKTNYERMYMDVSNSQYVHTDFTFLKSILTQNNIELIDTPAIDADIDGDTPLLAALREDIGLLFINARTSRDFSERELRAMELFVLFGGRILSNAYAGNQHELARRFGINLGARIPEDDQLYIQNSDGGPSRGHIIEVQQELRQGFVEGSEVIFLFPHEVNTVENGLFNHEVMATRNVNEEDKAVVVKAVPKLTFQEEQGFFIALGDDAFLTTQIFSGGSNLPTSSAYKGGLLTGANSYFVLNMILESREEEWLIINEEPIQNLSFDTPIIPSDDGLVHFGGTLNALGGVIKITYSINDGPEKIAFDPHNRPRERRLVHNSIVAGLNFLLPETELQIGTNTLRIKILDQFGNELNTVLNLIFGATTANQRIELISNQVGNNMLDAELGIDLFGSRLPYENQSLFGGPLSTSFWNGGTDCEIRSDLDLKAFSRMEAAPRGIGRVKNMNMATTSAVLSGLGILQDEISIYFGRLDLNDDIKKLLNGLERRDYNNTTSSTFEIRVQGRTIITAPMSAFRVLLDHNAPGNCNDDIITGTSGFIPISNLVISSGISMTDARIAAAVLADFAGSTNLRLKGIIYNRINHGSESEAFQGPGLLRYPLGVQHPDPAAVNLIGNAVLEVF